MVCETSVPLGGGTSLRSYTEIRMRYEGSSEVNLGNKGKNGILEGNSMGQG